ncbi:MAG: type II toxin-antitoxin system VapC family toxin [Chloroflexota bacterium]|nr:type II toxin-antitoxin system VapC family toxin [Chloroflexota bacterium]
MSANNSEAAPVYILDSFAVLAYLEAESGMERVKTLLQAAKQGDCQIFMSLINLGEVLYINEREQGLSKAQSVLAAIEQLPIEILPASSDMVFMAAHLKARFPLAYADAFAIAASQQQKGVLVTGDPEFEAVEHLITIDWLGRRL